MKLKHRGRLNNIYRLVWNETSNIWVAVAETAKGRGPRINSRQLLAAWVALLPTLLIAAPNGGNISLGNGNISQNGNTTTVTQQSGKLAIDWNSFSIGVNEGIRFVQPSSSSIVLNRVLGQSPSQILGTLSANGQVFILNPNGVLFGNSAQVNVGGLVASTLSLSNADFQTGNYRFSQSSENLNNAVVNKGTLIASDGGYIALLAPEVRNEGIISARLGTALLAAGNTVTLTFNNGSLLGYSVDKGALNALAGNQQLIKADGGQIWMSAKAADQLSKAVVNNSGIIEAHTIQNQGGVIKLIGDMQIGQVNMEGTLDASAPTGGNGGFIETSAAHVKVAGNARVNTTAAKGRTGEWLVDPNDFTIASSGGDITPTALSTQLTSSNVTISSVAGAVSGNGDIFVNDRVNWGSANTLTLNAERHINVNAAMSNSSGGSLALRADVNGAGTGTVTFGGSGSIAISGGGRADLYYNPSSYASPTDYSGNITGSYTAWMLVNNATQLQDISTNLSGNYALGKNIDASATSGWNGGAGFTPLATFNGKFDGLGKTISGLTINLPATDNIGLFSVNAGTISNVGVISGTITGRSTTGGLAGENQGTITGSYSTNAVNGEHFVGGLVGNNFSGHTISNSYATGTVAASSYVTGGLVGQNSGTISNSYATGAVSTPSDSAGGLVGENKGVINDSHATGLINATSGNAGGLVGQQNSSGTISNTYATGDVSGVNRVGGLVGNNSGSGSISNSYATGTISATSDTAGGLVGNNDTGAISDSHANGNVSGGNTIGGLVGKNTNSASITNSYAIGTATGTGGTVGGLVGNNEGSSTITTAYATGNVSGNDTTGGLVGNNNNSSITNSHSTGTVSGRDTIGGLVGGNSNNGSITNVYATGAVSLTADTGGGLAGRNDHGTITNAYSTSNVTGGTDTIGGLVGRNVNSASISNSHATGIASGSSHTIGGLIGNNSDSSTVTTSYATGNVSGRDTVGGLVGNNNSSASITKSYSTGSVTATNDNAGGLVGKNDNGTIANAYSTGNVSGADTVGGLAGKNENGGSINKVYSTGSASGTSVVGGSVGTNSATITNAYWDTQTSGTSTGIGGGTTTGASGLTSTQMKSASNFASLDFTADWTIYAGHTNPLLKSLLTALTITADSVSKTYDGQGLSGGLSNAIYSVAGADSSGHLYNLATPYGNNKNAGTYSADIWSDQRGYDVTLSVGNLTIDKAALTVTATASNKTYDRNTTAPVTLGDNRISGDTLTLNNTSATFADKNVGTGKTVTVAGITVGGTDAANYTFNTSTTTTANIDAATLTLAGATANNKTYDGNNTATISGGTFGGLIGGDSVTATTGTFLDKNAATGKAVTVTLAGTDAGNYSLTQPGLTADITKALLTVTANNSNKTHDGTIYSGGNGVSYAGFVNGETKSALSGTLTYAGSAQGAVNSGSYSIVAQGLIAENYAFNYINGVLTINAAPVSPPVASLDLNTNYNSALRSVKFTTFDASIEKNTSANLFYKAVDLATNQEDSDSHQGSSIHITTRKRNLPDAPISTESCNSNC